MVTLGAARTVAIEPSGRRTEVFAPRSGPLPERGPVSAPDGRVAGRYSRDGCTIVWAQGEIDVATAPDLRHELADAVSVGRCKVIVDLTQVTFMDSTGLNILVRARRAAEARGGELRLVGAGETIRRLMCITGLDQIFTIHSTIEESIG